MKEDFFQVKEKEQFYIDAIEELKTKLNIFEEKMQYQRQESYQNDRYYKVVKGIICIFEK
jgi:ppGpp synthetase/RelA/SpoT-type nucleotidyltranferase